MERQDTVLGWFEDVVAIDREPRQELFTAGGADSYRGENESKFSADGLAVFLGQERYSMALTIRIFGGHTFLSLFLLKPGFKSLRVTEAELAPWCKEVIV